MSLLDLWNEKRTQLDDKTVSQIIGFAGNGRLLDGNLTSTEFREFLSVIAASDLKSYANECLEESFQDSGFALQDIVNEIGRRLGGKVENGKYRGKQNETGHD